MLMTATGSVSGATAPAAPSSVSAEGYAWIGYGYGGLAVPVAVVLAVVINPLWLGLCAATTVAGLAAVMARYAMQRAQAQSAAGIALATARARAEEAARTAP